MNVLGTTPSDQTDLPDQREYLDIGADARGLGENDDFSVNGSVQESSFND